MANQFVLTAQIALQAPTNARQTLNQIQRQLQGVNVAVNLNSNPAQIKALNQQLNSVNQSAKAASNSVSELGKTIGAAARRFGAISLATGTFLNLTRAVKGSISDAIEFERQMIILSQTTEKSVRELGDLYREVTRLSTGLGVSSDGLIKTSIVLAQAGLEARKAKAALEVLAKTQLAASFDDIQSTTEGAIAILAQFRREAAGAGGDIKFLETSLEAINQVSKKYAVESSDLIAVIRRSGGAFEAAGGSLNELLALFTSVRATTRESAETISTGLRTIFTRIQRVDTIKQLKELGIALQDAEGKFVGPFEAIKRISEGLSSLDPRDFRFAQIVEELGGFRQIGKVIPLIKQFALAQEALNTAQIASGSLTKDTETAQLSLANKITKVKEEFQALIREFTQGEGFQSVARGALEFARALIRIADAIEPILPLIASLGALQVGRGLASALGAFSGFTKKNSGGKIMAFATGGMVPGTGNRDTVPAMLSPGEFVIRKSSVKKIGAENLQRLNAGGMVDGIKNQDTVGALILKPGKDISNANVQVTNADIEAKAAKQKKNIDSKIFSNNVKSYNLARSGIKDDTFLESLNEGINQGLTTAIQLASNGVSSLLGLPAINPSPEQTKKLANSINPGARGTIFEEVIANISRNSGGEPFDNRNDPNAPFDFIGSIGKAKDLFENQIAATTKYKDAKASLESAQPKEFLGKIANQIVKEAPLNTLGIQQASLKSNALEDYFATNKTIGQSEALKLLGEKPLKGKQAQNKLASYGLRQTGELKNQSPLYERIGFAKGGAAPSDTVPALLTPGEFVVKKSTAQKVGYGALDRMNKTGQVQGYANGGIVGMAKGGNPAKAKYKAQRSAERKQATLAQQGLLFTPEDQIDYTKLGGAARQAPKSTGQGGQSEARAAGSIVPGAGQAAASPGLAAVRLSTKTVIELGKRAEALGLDYQAGAVLEKKYLQQRKLGLSREEAYQKALEAATKNLKNRTKAETTAEVKKQPVSINTEAVQKIAQSAQNFIFLAGTASTLAAQFSSLDDASKEAITQTIAFGATLAGTLGTVADVGINIGRSLPAGIKDNLAKGLGAAVPLLTNPIALVAGGIALALGGIIYAYKAYQRALSDQAKKQAQQVASDIEQGKKGVSARDEYIKLEVEAANRMIKSFWISSGVIDNETEARKRAASSYIDTVINLRNLDEQLRAVDADRSLSPLEAASKKIKIQSDSSAASLKILNDASSQLASIFAKTGTKNVQQLESKVGSKQPVVDTAKTALDAFNKNIENNKSAISASLANLQSVFEESSKNFSYETGAGAASPFEQVLAKSNEFASAFAATRKTVENSMNSMAVSMIQAGQPADQVAEELFKFKSSLMAAERSYIKQAEVNKKAAESTALLNKALRESAQSAFVSGKLRESLSGIAESGKTLSLNLGNINSVIQQEFSAFTLPEVQGLDNLSNIVNFDKFQSELDNIASNFGEFGTRAANEISGVAKVLTASRTLLGREFVGVGDDAGSEAKKAIDDILEPLKGIGGSIGSLRDRARADLEKAAAGGGEQGAVVTQSEIENALSPLKEFVNQNTELFKTFAEEQRNLVSTYAEHIKSLEDSFTREADLRERLAEIEATGAERMAQARDKTLTFQQKDAARLKGTQARLGVAGVNVGAADISGLSKEAIRLQQDLRNLSKEAEANKDNAVKVKQLNEQQGKLKTQLKEVTSALKNMADQGAKAADILADIEKEKAKRETGTKILTDFVTGSLEERGGIMKSFAGLQIAQQTGTLQNFDADTRKSVVGLLDQLGSVDKRFEELKKNLVFSDAMRMGFDPDTAMKLATATPKEEQLKKALEQTTAQELMATQALIAQEEDNRKATEENTAAIGSLINDLPDKMTKAISDGYAEFERLRFQKEKESNDLRQKDLEAARREQERRATEEAEYAKRLKGAKDETIQSLQEFSTALNNAKAGFAKGGTVYAANGALMKPKGTDTVPAMLTPGEFVVRKSSVDKYGVGMMKAINNGQYLADGGLTDEDEAIRKRLQANAFSVRSGAVSEEARLQSLREDSDKAIQAARLKQIESTPISQDTIFSKERQPFDVLGQARRRLQGSGNQPIKSKDQKSAEFYKNQIAIKDLEIADRNEQFRRTVEDEPELIDFFDKMAPRKPTGNVINSKGFIKGVPTRRGSPEQVRERQKQLRQQAMGFGGGSAYNDPINSTLRNLVNPQQQAAMGPLSRQEQTRQNQLRIQAQQRGMPVQNVYNPMSSAQGGQDAAMNGFKDFGQQITEAAKMLNGMTMNHTVTVDGMLNVNSAEVAQAVKDSVGEFVAAKIAEVLKQPNPFVAGNSTPKR